jgi:hypothetical protein
MMTLVRKLDLPKVGTATAASPAPFDVVSGNIYFGPYGSPPSVGVIGGTVDARGGDSFYGQINFTTQPRIFAGAWLFIKSQGIVGANPQFIIRTDTGMHLASANGGISAWSEFVWNSPLTGLDPNNQWVFFGMAASLVSGTGYDLKFYYKTLTGNLTAWASNANDNIFAAMTGVKFGMGLGNASNPIVEFACTSPCIYTYANNDFSDIVYPSEILLPPPRGDYYLNPATGNDANDGTTAGSAWRTCDKINAVSAHTGILPATSYASGSKLTIDTTSSDLDVGQVPSGLVLSTRGLTVIGPDSLNRKITVRAYVVIAGAQWVVVGSGVYSAPNSSPDAVLWEDSKWMNHPNGADYASVSAALASTPGSFWTDGATMYLHPFGNTDPRSDGKTYARSAYPGTRSAIWLMAPDMDICGITVGMTCDVQTGGTSQSGYGIGSSSSAFGGISRVRECYCYYGGKHALGFTNDTTNSDITVENCQVEQCSPYSGQSCFVNYMADTGGTMTGNIARYRRNICNKNSGLIGSAAGQNTNQQVWLCHNNGAGVQWVDFEFTDNMFPRGSIQSGMIDTFRITGGRLGAVAAYSPNTICERVYFDAEGFQVNVADVPGRNIVRNCLVVPEIPFGGGNNGWTIRGKITVEGCTFDMTKVPAGPEGVALYFLEGSSKPVDVIFHNNVIKSNGKHSIIVYGKTGFDVLTFDYNAYSQLANSVAVFYNNGSGASNYTFAQWQAIGYDTHSFQLASLALDANLKPMAGSPVINAGVNLGPMQDYTGKSFTQRNDIGAYEYAPSSGSDPTAVSNRICQPIAGNIAWNI